MRARRPIVAVIIAVGVSLAGCTSGSTPAPPDAGIRIAAPPTGTATMRPSVPAAAPISLTLDSHTSRVIPVDVDSAQSLQIPNQIRTLGWWQGGAKAGASSGFVVITGHSTRQGTGAANAWWTVRPGDVVTLRTEAATITYRVVSRTTYPKTTIPLSRWFPAGGPHGPAGLALITCSDFSSGEWRANTVVEAVPLRARAS